MQRRSFLKLASGLVVAGACALYIPPERLDMGVPRAILTASEMPESQWIEPVVQGQWAGSVPMLLVHDEFRPPGFRQFGRDHVPAGTTLMVDRPTAERWIEHGVGTPGQMAPLDLQQASAQRWVKTQATDYALAPGVDTFAHFVTRADVAPVDLRRGWGDPVPASVDRTRSDAFDLMVKRATAKARGSDASAWWDSIPEGSILVDRSMLACRCFPISAEDADA